MLKNLSLFGVLIKYKLSLAVVLSSITGYYLFNNTIDNHLIYLTAGVFLLASGSAALNQFTERSADSIMERTRLRPIPSQKISKNKSLILASSLLTSGCLFLFFNGTIPFLLGVFTVLLYNLIYTNLKKITVFSIIPGALVGALPPLIGYSSAGGSIMHINIIAFSMFMFFWQIPHFWLIIIKYGKEYKAAGFASISNYLNELQIRYLVFFWVLFSSIFLFLFCAFSEAMNKSTFLFLSVLNLSFILGFYRFLFMRKKSQEIRGAFILINSFGILIMFLIIVSSVLKGS